MSTSEEMAISLPKGNIRQWVVINLLRQNKPDFTWESSIQGDKFDILGYPKDETRGNHTREILLEVRGTSRTNIEYINKDGQFINRNKIKHGLAAQCDGALCYFVLVVPTQGVFWTKYPNIVPTDWQPMKRNTNMENTGKQAMGTLLRNFKKMFRWKDYWNTAEKVIQDIVPLYPDMLPEYKPQDDEPLQEIENGKQERKE